MIKKPPPLVVRKAMHCACRSGAVNNLLAHGSTYQEILSEYEGVTIDDIRACILWKKNYYLPELKLRLQRAWGAIDLKVFFYLAPRLGPVLPKVAISIF